MKYERLAGVVPGVILLLAFLALSCPMTTSTSSGGSGGIGVAPVMLSISACLITTPGPAPSLAANDWMECTITSDIDMSSATIFLRDTAGIVDYGSQSTTPNAKTTTIRAYAPQADGATPIYPKVKICSSMNCNTYEYNAATPNVYYQVGVGFTNPAITLTFY